MQHGLMATCRFHGDKGLPRPFYKIHNSSSADGVQPAYNPEQSFRDPALRPWLLIIADGELQVAHCTCMAGLGEACSHVGAVLFYIDAVIKRQSESACTDKENAWLPPHIRVLEWSVGEIDFASSKMKKKMLDGQQPRRHQTARNEVQAATPSEWAHFLSVCSTSTSRPTVLSLEDEYANRYIPVATRFPEVILTNNHMSTAPPPWDKILQDCNAVAERLRVSPEVAAAVEEQTKEQARSALWFARLCW